MLSMSSILAVRRVKESDMFKLSKATGAKVVNNLDDLAANDLGSAELVEERKVETNNILETAFFEVFPTRKCSWI